MMHRKVVIGNGSATEALLDNVTAAPYRCIMEAIVGHTDTTQSDSHNPIGDDPSQRPWRLLRRALKWMVLAIVMVLVVALAPIVFDGTLRVISAARHLTPNPPRDFSVLIAYSAIALQAVLLWGAFRGARAAADGNLGVGLANRPVRRRGLVALFALLILAWDIAAIGALVWVVEHGGHAPALPSEIVKMPPGIGLAAIHIAFLGLIAPVAEELFFRGWLWTALRKSWSPAKTMGWTTGLWLAMHFMDGTWRPFLLLPIGILLALARYYGDSVRASLMLHLMNNGMVVLIQLAALLAAGQPATG